MMYGFHKRHPSITCAPSYKAEGTWVRSKRTGAVGYIHFVIKYRGYMDLPAEVFVVFPPTPHNKRITGIKTYTGGVYTSKELVRLRARRRRIR